MTEHKLLELKDQIEDAKSEVSKLEGRRDALREELKDDWACGTIKQAKNLLGDLEKELTQLENKLSKGIKELEEKYEFE